MDYYDGNTVTGLRIAQNYTMSDNNSTPRSGRPPGRAQPGLGQHRRELRRQPDNDTKVPDPAPSAR